MPDYTPAQLALPETGHDRLLRYPELRAAGIPFSRQHLVTLERDGRFPKRVRLSERVVVWRLSEIQEWLAERAGQR